MQRLTSNSYLVSGLTFLFGMRYFAVILLFLICSCNTKQDNITNGYKPIYAPAVDLIVESQPSRAIQNAGKIYSLGNYLLIVDIGKGVHVIDQSNPSSPLSVSFMKIEMIRDFTINSNVLYAQAGSDLVVVDISNILQIKQIKRDSNVFSNTTALYPPNYSGYFECVDESRKNLVIGWEYADKLVNPKCKL